MQSNTEDLSALKYLLENIRDPQKVESHFWINKHFVQESLIAHPSRRQLGNGEIILYAIADLFSEMVPATPPIQGKRLDTRWGRFGILAAYYFTPFFNNIPYPPSLRDAWRKIDRSIAVFLGDRPGEPGKFQFISDEVDFPANSTISDWHRNGLLELLDVIRTRETKLAAQATAGEEILDHEPGEKPNRKRYHRNKQILIFLSLLVLSGLLVIGGLKVNSVLGRIAIIKQDLALIREMDFNNISRLDSETTGALINKAGSDIKALQSELSPWSWLTNRLGWIPVYGGDIQNSDEILNYAGFFMESVEKVYSSGIGLLDTYTRSDGSISGKEITAALIDIQPQLLEARQKLDLAAGAGKGIERDALSQTTSPVVALLDRYFSLYDESLSLAINLPALLGAAEDGPKKYLVLIQNEDELRPSGGFITAFAEAVVFQGDVLSLEFTPTDNFVNREKVFPAAPWQMQDFMNIHVLIFRDSNWYADFRTTAIWAEYLYTYTGGSPLDGIIAIDQQLLAGLLSITGPLDVPDLDRIVSAANIYSVMRLEKSPSAEEMLDPNWDRKNFMEPIAEAVLGRLLSAEDLDWKAMTSLLVGMLNNKHILLQVDDRDLMELIARRGWDGALRRENSDFLMVVEANIGYNKVNANVEREITYDVDLSDINLPTSNLTVRIKNLSRSNNEFQCTQYTRIPEVDDSANIYLDYPMEGCYYSYVRVFLPENAKLAGGQAMPVTRDDMVMLSTNVPPRFDDLNETIPGIDGFGTLVLVRKESDSQTRMSFELPASDILTHEADGSVWYRLKIQKQPGVDHIPFTLRIHIPANMHIQTSLPIEGERTSSAITYQFDLEEDVVIGLQLVPN